MYKLCNQVNSLQTLQSGKQSTKFVFRVAVYKLCIRVSLPQWDWGSRIGLTYPPACHKRRFIGGIKPVCCGLRSVSVEERILAVELILCCGFEEAIHSFGLNFT